MAGHVRLECLEVRAALSNSMASESICEHLRAIDGFVLLFKPLSNLSSGFQLCLARSCDALWLWLCFGDTSSCRGLQGISRHIRSSVEHVRGMRQYPLPLGRQENRSLVEAVYFLASVPSASVELTPNC